MKVNFLMTIVASMLMAGASKPSQQPEVASRVGTNQPAADEIIGFWKLKLEA